MCIKARISGMIVNMAGFKIRTREDAEVFVRDCIYANTTIKLVLNLDEEYEYTIYKDRRGEVSVSVRRGNLMDPFNPSLELANNRNKSYKTTVEDEIWKIRKYVNSAVLT